MKNKWCETCGLLSLLHLGLLFCHINIHTGPHYTAALHNEWSARVKTAPRSLWLALTGLFSSTSPKGLAGKQEEGPETAHIIPASISKHPTKLDPSEARICCLCSGCYVSADEWKQATSKLISLLKPVLTTQTLNIFFTKMVQTNHLWYWDWKKAQKYMLKS